jgi:hypothetical protein
MRIGDDGYPKKARLSRFLIAGEDKDVPAPT